MARQVRSETTRRKILDAAVEVFDELGYAGADRAAIVERTGMTKGAFYHHFDSMESLASAIIDEGAKRVLDVLAAAYDPFAPALENIMHGSFLAAEVFASDKVARTAEQLTLAFGKFNDTGARIYPTWVEGVAGEAKRAIAEGDLREGLDPKMVSESIISATFGTRILSQSASSANDLIGRLTQMWELFLPAIVTATSLAYYREYLAREAMRHVKHESAT
jgi:AcrR family transcriptional regulator